jgi:hypothetical protein
MPFIDMPYRGLDSHLPQRSDTANAKQDFLLDAQVTVAAVELMRDIAVVRRIFR